MSERQVNNGDRAPESEIDKHRWDFVTATGGALFGTVAGALMAFWLERRKRVVETEDRHVESVNVAIFNLTQIYAYLSDYQRQVIERNPPGARQWYELSRTRLQPPDLQPFDVRSLAFLFESEHKDLVNRIAIDLTRYEGFLMHIERAQRYNDDVQQMARVTTPTPQKISELETVCGQILIQQVRTAVESIIEFHTRLMPSVMESAIALGRAVKAMYPDRTIIHFEDVNKAISSPV